MECHHCVLNQQRMEKSVITKNGIAVRNTSNVYIGGTPTEGRQSIKWNRTQFIAAIYLYARVSDYSMVLLSVSVVVQCCFLVL